MRPFGAQASGPRQPPRTSHGTSTAGTRCRYWQAESGQRERRAKGLFACMSARNGHSFPWLLARLGEDTLGVSSEGC